MSGSSEEVACVIRKVVPGDAASVVALCSRERITTYLSLLDDEHRAAFLDKQKVTPERIDHYRKLSSLSHVPRLQAVAVLNDEIVGYHASKVEEGIVYLTALFVDEGYHGRGIGRALMQYMIDYYPGMALRLHVLAGNKRAISMYETFGFKRTSFVPDPYFGAERVQMELPPKE